MKKIIETFNFASASSAAVYQTVKYSDGTVSCNCPGWTNKKKGASERTCRHAKAVVGVLSVCAKVSKGAKVVKVPTVAKGQPSIQETKDRAARLSAGAAKAWRTRLANQEKEVASGKNKKARAAILARQEKIQSEIAKRAWATRKKNAKKAA